MYLLQEKILASRIFGPTWPGTHRHDQLIFTCKTLLYGIHTWTKLLVPPGLLPSEVLEAHSTSSRPQGKPRIHCRYYESSLVWECLLYIYVFAVITLAPMTVNSSALPHSTSSCGDGICCDLSAANYHPHGDAHGQISPIFPLSQGLKTWPCRYEFVKPVHPGI